MKLYRQSTVRPKHRLVHELLVRGLVQLIVQKVGADYRAPCLSSNEATIRQRDLLILTYLSIETLIIVLHIA